jgi:hypothetical protein
MKRTNYEVPVAEALSFVLEKTILDSLKFGEDNKPGSLDSNDIINEGDF